MTVAAFLRRNEVRIAGLLGVVGMAMGVAADLASGYSTSGADGVTTAFSVLTLSNLVPFLASKPAEQVVLGHYLAVLGIPLGMFGLWQVYRAIEPAGWALSRAAWLLGVFGFVAGTVFHASFAFVTFGIQAADATPAPAEEATRTMLDRFALVFEPLGILLVGAMVAALGLVLYAVAFRETRYPRWFALANPLLLQAATGALGLVAPPEVRVFLVVTAYNLSVLVFFAVSTVLLWDHERYRAYEEQAVGRRRPDQL